MSDIWHYLCEISLVPSEGACFSVLCAGELLAVTRLADGTLKVFEDSCPHMGAPMNNGIVEGSEITCLWHCWRFSLLDGSCSNFPGFILRVFSVKEEFGKVFVRLG